MAELLFKKGGFRILSDDVGKLSAKEVNQLIKDAGTTCYQTRETSKKSPEEFIKMLQTSTHYSVLEHSWFCFSVSILGGSVKEIGFELYKANSLFCITLGIAKDLIISGNSQMFNAAYLKNPQNIALKNIYSYLHGKNPELFPYEVKYEVEAERFTIGAFPNPELIAKNEILVHRAMTVEFNNHCRGFTHEDVRHRNGDEKIASYSQESTRYVDYSKGKVSLDYFKIKFILPYNDKFNLDWAVNKKIEFFVDEKEYSFTPQEFTNLIEGWYRALRKEGLKPEEARQWLSIGLKSQIVQTYNLNEWRHWFYRRADRAAHPEIRFSAVYLLAEVQKRMPGIFDDFKIHSDLEVPYAVYIGKNPLI